MAGDDVGQRPSISQRAVGLEDQNGWSGSQKHNHLAGKADGHVGDAGEGEFGRQPAPWPLDAIQRRTKRDELLTGDHGILSVGSIYSGGRRMCQSVAS